MQKDSPCSIFAKSAEKKNGLQVQRAIRMDGYIRHGQVHLAHFPPEPAVRAR